MAVERAIPRLRITFRGALFAVFAIALTQFVLARLPSAQRVIGWTIAAAAIAALVYPAVEFLARAMPRSLAILLVAAAVFAPIIAISYAAVSDVQRELTKLERFAPNAAERIEQREDRIGEFAREFELRKKVKSAVSSIPQRLASGGATDTTTAISETATRGVAFLTTGFLIIFFLASGRAMVDGALRQFIDEHRRERARFIAVAVYNEAFGYARGAIALACITGTVAWATARLAGVPGAVVIGIWVGLLDLLPVFGTVLGWAPLIALAYVQSPGAAVVSLIIFATYQALDSLVIRRYLERSTLRLGRFLPVIGAFGGLELHGVGGALVGILAMAIAASALRELTQFRDEDYAAFDATRA